MTKREILCTPFGEMQDMITCMSIYEGGATPKNARKWTHDEAINLR